MEIDIEQTNTYIANYHNDELNEILSDEKLIDEYLKDEKIKLFSEILAKNKVTNITDIIHDSVKLLIPSGVRSKIKLIKFIEYSRELIEPLCSEMNLEFYSLRVPDGNVYRKLPTPTWSIKSKSGKILIGYMFIKYNNTALELLKNDYDDIIIIVPDMKPIKLGKDKLIPKKISQLSFMMCHYQNINKLLLFDALPDFLTEYFKN